MTDNKFIPKLPETKTEIVLSQEQQNLQEPKSTAGKIVETVKETVIPTVHAQPDPDDVGEVAKGVVGGAIAAASVIPSPIQPFAAAAGVTEAVGGKAMEQVGKMTDNKAVEEGGKHTKEIGEVGSLPEAAKGGAEILKKAGGA